MIFDMVINVTLINLAEMECILLQLKSFIFLCLCVKESCLIKMIFRVDENLTKFLDCKCYCLFIYIYLYIYIYIYIYIYCNLIKTYKLL